MMARPIGSSVSLYPRICGANDDGPADRLQCVPLPPHMRGKRSLCVPGDFPVPSTPAYAGQTHEERSRPEPCTLYPRICGANDEEWLLNKAEAPLPPHMRGKRGSNGRRRYRQASTPAYAGQTHRWPERVRPAGLYPRICGANGSPACTRPRARPLPPHMRGKPSWSAWDRCDACLYPRICGANLASGDASVQEDPLPPHMRGKRRRR